MKYSVLIPALNEEKYIGNLLDCLTNQTYKDFEVIVVDGKSEDKTCDIVNSYKNKLNLTLIISPKRGVAFQRNLAGRNASASRLTFIDADGRIRTDFFEKLNSHVAKFDPDILGVWIEPDSGKIIDNVIYWVFNALYRNLVKKYTPNATGNFIFVKKEAFNKVDGFNEDIIWAEDADFTTRVYKAGYNNYSLLKDPKIIASMRRLDKYGRFNFVIEQIKFTYYLHFAGGAPRKSEHENLSYEFGGYE